jgi:hypothetical protein
MGLYATRVHDPKKKAKMYAYFKSRSVVGWLRAMLPSPNMPLPSDQIAAYPLICHYVIRNPRVHSEASNRGQDSLCNLEPDNR